MRYLVISDIHANLTAFETVLKDAGRLGADYDFVWCLGDVVGYGPDPNECVELLRSMPHLCLAGNHDWAALGRLDVHTFNADARKSVTFTRDALSDENLAYLEAYPGPSHCGAELSGLPDQLLFGRTYAYTGHFQAGRRPRGSRSHCAGVQFR